ncbi:hypothetical protein D3260_14695 [Salinisphaera sp. Q1T1-3]|nr:hypothetical protein D3260_14695 [Salinisphaera sp. Q1T1-3]
MHESIIKRTGVNRSARRSGWHAPAPRARYGETEAPTARCLYPRGKRHRMAVSMSGHVRIAGAR